VCKEYNQVVKNHQRFLNGTGVLEPSIAFPADRRGYGNVHVPSWRSVRCSLTRLDRCDFIRDCWNANIQRTLRKLELYKITNRCQVFTRFIGSCPMLEELSMIRVSIRGAMVHPPMPQNARIRPQPAIQYCGHRDLREHFGHLAMQPTIRKVKFVRLPVIPTCRNS
jgi:hypothetical protein